jgi:hypothetical protein
LVVAYNTKERTNMKSNEVQPYWLPTDRFAEKRFNWIKCHAAMRLMGVDPGYNTGMAMWECDQFKYGFFAKPVKVKEEIEIMKYMAHNFEEWLSRWNPHMVIIENVAYWGDDSPTRTSKLSDVSSARGDLLKTHNLIITYVWCCINRGITPVLRTTMQWKGQLTKNATTLRLYREIGDFSHRDINDHAEDALAIVVSELHGWVR